MFINRPYLGELELAVLGHIWLVESSDVKETYAQIGIPRDISTNTVQSAMERLFKKKLLVRQKISHAYVYSAAVSREDIMTTVIDNVVDKLSGGNTEVMLSTFVNIADRADEETLSRLEQIISERRQSR